MMGFLVDLCEFVKNNAPSQYSEIKLYKNSLGVWDVEESSINLPDAGFFLYEEEDGEFHDG